MKIAIIEDSPTDQYIIEESIKKYLAFNRVLGDLFLFESGEAFLETAEIDSYDVVFIDIFLKTLNGMDIAKQIRTVNTQTLIIFVSSSEQYAVKSYDVDALYYLLKPYTYEQFSQVMERVIKKLKTNQLYIEVKSGGEKYKIPLSHILFTDYYAHYVQIHTTNGVVRTYIKFAEIEEILLKYRDFLRCFRNIVVNMNYITAIDNNFFVINTNERLPINRKEAKEIKEQYRSYMFEKIEQERFT